MTIYKEVPSSSAPAVYEREFKGIWIPAHIWLNRDLTIHERIMLVEIDSLSTSKDRGCWAGNEHFSKLFGLSKSRVSEIVNSLKKKGFISVSMKRKGNQIIERNIFISDLKPTNSTHSEDVKEVSCKHAYPVRDSEGGCSGNAEGSNTSFNNTKNLKDIDQNTLINADASIDSETDSGLKDKDQNKSPEGKDNNPTRLHLINLFDKFYEAFPKKVNRKKALASWLRLKPNDDLYSTITGNVKNRINLGDWNIEDKKFIPGPDVFLNGEKWEDEIIPVKQKENPNDKNTSRPSSWSREFGK